MSAEEAATLVAEMDRMNMAVMVNLSGGVRTKSLGVLSEGSVQVGVTNLANKKYIATIGSNGFVNSGDSQTLLQGTPRQVFITFTGKL